MAKFKNITPDTRYIAYGVASPRGVLPDSVVEVDDDAAEGYAEQTEIWQAVTDAPAARPVPTPALPAVAPSTPSEG